MTRIETQVHVALSPRRLFAYFIPQRIGYWYGPNTQTEFEVSDGAAEFAVAQKVRISGRIGRRQVSHTAVVTECRWGETLEWRFEDRSGLRGTERWDFEPVEIGGTPGTLLRMRSDYEFTGFVARAVNWILTRHAVARRNRDFLKRLKRLAEPDK
ncbi:MAG: SRPBCC family protein [Candidatus Acidiferrales bacterium]